MRKITLILLLLIGFVSFSATTDKSTRTLSKSEYTCVDQWSDDMDCLMEFGATFDEALVLADRVFEKCLDEWYPWETKLIIDKTACKRLFYKNLRYEKKN